MTADELRDAFKLRFDDAGRAVYMLPQDIIDNTVKALERQRHVADRVQRLGAPEGRYIAPANGPDCIEIAQRRRLQQRVR